MRVVIAGGHGQIARRLERLLAQRESAGITDVARLLESAEAAVFAAGAGPGSGAARKETVDYAAAVLFADAAEAAGVRRFLVISSMGADRPPPEGTDPVFAAYLRAKAAADANVQSRTALDWTILRPGHLTNDQGTGHVTLAESTGRGDVARDDVAAVLVALLSEPGTVGRTLELIGGDTPIVEAVNAFAARH
jgi:nucleoside-diphosphate-sugar epimerase